MARWRGIFGRKGNRDGDPDATPTGSGEAGTDPVTALYPARPAETEDDEEPRAAGNSDEAYTTDDWEEVADAGAEVDEGRPEAEPPESEDRDEAEDRDPTAPSQAPHAPPVKPFDPDTGTAEWAPPSPVSGRRAAEPEIDLEVVRQSATEDEDAEPMPADRDPDTGERIQAAADEAAQVAEIRSHDEIIALERDLEQAHADARSQIDGLTERLAETEARANRAEEESRRLAGELEQVETQAREAATRWLRGQVAKLRADFDQRVREEVDRIHAVAPPEVDTDSAAADPETADHEVQRLRRELELTRSKADARVAEAQEAAREAEAASAIHAPAASGDDAIEGRLESARLAGRAELQAEIDQSAEGRRQELEQRALAAAQAGTDERIARVEADAEERIRAEVAVARGAAEERFAEKLAERERDLQAERESKAGAIEQSHERLTQIETQAVEAAQRVSDAERHLGEEKLRLQKESAAQLEVATGQANALAAKDAAERLRDREEELTDAIAAAEQAKLDVEAKVNEAEERAERAEQRTREVETEAAAAISEVRQAAADWLREQTKSLRDEADSPAPSSDD